jgi:carboxyl-terminal processing protease
MKRYSKPFHSILKRAGLTAGLVSLMALSPLQVMADTQATTDSTAPSLPTDSGNPPATLSQDEQKILEIYEYIHKYHMDPIDEDTLMKGAIQGMLSATGDPYTDYFSPEEYQQFIDDLNQTFVGIGIHIQQSGQDVLVADTIPGGPAEQAGIKAGDKIVSINQQPVQGKTLDQIRNLLLGKVDTQVTVGVLRTGQTQPLTFTIVRKQFQVPVITSKLTPEKLGYIQLSDFSETSGDDFRKALQNLMDQGAKGIILDLRGNPGGVLQQAVQIADQFLSTGLIVKTAESDGSTESFMADGKGIAPNLPLVVLVDGNSASAAEALAGSLKVSGRATLVGTKTFGKGTMQIGIPLDTGGVLKLTIGKYYFADGSNPNHTGIQPDITIENPDLQYNEAVQLLLPNRHQVLQYSLQSGNGLLNGNPVQTPSPFQQGGVTYIPLRYTLEAFGVPVSWDPQTSRILCGSDAKNPDQTVLLTSTTYLKGNLTQQLKQPLINRNGITYISLDDLNAIFPLHGSLKNGNIRIEQP